MAKLFSGMSKPAAEAVLLRDWHSNNNELLPNPGGLPIPTPPQFMFDMIDRSFLDQDTKNPPSRPSHNSYFDPFKNAFRGLSAVSCFGKRGPEKDVIDQLKLPADHDSDNTSSTKSFSNYETNYETASSHSPSIKCRCKYVRRKRYSEEIRNDKLRIVFLGSKKGNLCDLLVKEGLSEQKDTCDKMGDRSKSRRGIDLSVHTWTPKSSKYDATVDSVRGTYNACNGGINFILWDLHGLHLETASNRSTQSLCIAPNSLYVIVWQIPTLSRSHNYDEFSSGFNEDGYSSDDNFIKCEDLEEFHRDTINRSMDEQFFSWIDVFNKHNCEGCAILPVLSIGSEHHDTIRAEDIELCLRMFKRRVFEFEIIVPKVVFDHGEIPTIFPTRDNGTNELRQAICNIAFSTYESVFYQHLKTKISPIAQCLRGILTQYRNIGYDVLPTDDLLIKFYEDPPEIEELNQNLIFDALKFLSSIGEIMFFSEEDGRCSHLNALSKFIILKPQWMTSAISSILRDDWECIRSKVKSLNMNRSFPSHHNNRREQDMTFIEGIMSDGLNCPILSAENTTQFWKTLTFIKKAHKRISKSEGENDLFQFLQHVSEYCGVFIPLPSSVVPCTFYFLPGLCGESPPRGFWDFKSKEDWKTTLCQSWLLNNQIPCGVFGEVSVCALDEIRDMIDLKSECNTMGRLLLRQLICWKTAIYAKVIRDVPNSSSYTVRPKNNVVELFVQIVHSDSSQCPAQWSSGGGMKLVVSARGNIGCEGIAIWNMGYKNLLDCVEGSAENMFGRKLQREVLCPNCLANSDPRRAKTWKVDNYSAYEQTDTMTCAAGHHVSRRILYGPSGDDTDTLTSFTSSSCCTSSSCTSTHTHNSYYGDDRPGKSIEELVQGVVLVGLWDFQKKVVISVGTGFIFDARKGLIMTAGHIFYDMVEGGNIGKPYRGLEHGRAVIGTIPTANGTVSYFTYSANILDEDKDKANVDACVLRITSKFARPVQCKGTNLGIQNETIVGNSLRQEKLQQLNVTRQCRMEEQVRVIGFNQTGEGRLKQGHHVNHSVCISKGYVCKIPDKDSIVSYNRKSSVFSPVSEIVVDCAAYQGHSGGPCVNQDGRIIGIVSRVDPQDHRRCYLVPSIQLKKIIKRACRIANI